MWLNVGAGSSKDSWSVLEHRNGDNVDIVYDLSLCSSRPIPLAQDSCRGLRLEHVIEHLISPLDCLNELYRIAKPDSLILITFPNPYSEDAWCDPTHVRPITFKQFIYYSQPMYHMFDYGYEGDWQVVKTFCNSRNRDQCLSLLDAPSSSLQFAKKYPNLIYEFGVIMRAIKPARPRKRELLTALPSPSIEHNFNWKCIWNKDNIEIEHATPFTPSQSVNDTTPPPPTLVNGTDQIKITIRKKPEVVNKSIMLPSVAYIDSNGGQIDLPSISVFELKSQMQIYNDATVVCDSLGIVDQFNQYNAGGVSFARTWYRHKDISSNTLSYRYKHDISGAAIMLGHLTHYGHFYVDLLDKIQDSLVYKDCWLIVNGLKESSAQYLQILSRVLDIPLQDLKERLICPEDLSVLSFNALVNTTNRSTKLCISSHLIELTDCIREWSLEDWKLGKVSSKRNLYISRSDATKRFSLESEDFINYVRNTNLFILKPGNHSFAEQVSFFSSASNIIMPLGSECYNLLYCQKGTNVFALSSEEYVQGNGDFISMLRSICVKKSLNLKLIGLKNEVNPGRACSTLHDSNILVCLKNKGIQFALESVE